MSREFFCVVGLLAGLRCTSSDMANQQNVELESAKFRRKLIQSPKMSLRKWLQSFVWAMETVIKEHNLDIETLMPSRLPLAAGTQTGDYTSPQLAGSCQRVVAAKEPMSGNESSISETHTGPGCGRQDMYKGPAAHISGKS